MYDEDDPIIQIFNNNIKDIETSEPEKEKNIDSSENKQNNDKLESNLEKNIKEDSENKQNQESEKKIEVESGKKEGKNNKKIEEDKAKKIDEFFPKNLSPLDFVNYIEVQRMSGTVMNEMQNFILEKYMNKNNKYHVLETKSLSQINNEIADINIRFTFTKNDLILFYTKNDSILTFSIQKQNFIKAIYPKNCKNSEINCLDITDDLNELICGYQDGTIELINIQNGETKYSNNKVHKETSCIELKIFKKDKDKKEIIFISSGGDGNAFLNIIKIGITSIFTRINSSPVLTNISQYPIFFIKYFDNNLNLAESYVILGSINEISIYCIEPTIEKLFSIQKPKYVDEYAIPDAHVGIGRLPWNKNMDDNNIILIISLANIIYFYILEINEKNIINNYKEIGNYMHHCNILRIGFLSNSVIYIIDETFSIKLIDSQRINKGKIILSKETNEPIIFNTYTSEIESNHFISPSLSSQSKIFDSNKNPIKTYLYSILENNSFLYILASNQIFTIKLADWENFLNDFKKKEDYLSLFSVGIKLYKNNFHALSNIPDRKKDKEKAKKQIGDFLRQIISQYVIINTDEKKDIDTINTCIKLTIEFCIEIEAVEFLLTKIEPIFELKEYTKFFLEKLTPFILRDKIINMLIPSDIILNLIDFYDKNGMSDNLNHLLLHVNIKSLDNLKIKDKMEELNLTIPLIYLYLNGENPDYIIPLQKMFNYYQKAESIYMLLLEKENNAIDYGNELNNNKEINLKKILESKEYNGHKILWYIRWILTGKKFPDEAKNIEKNIFANLVPKITYWLLNEKVIEEFLRFDPKNYFMIHKNIFSFKSLYDLLINSSNDPKIKISILASLFNDVYKLNDIHPLSLIDYMVAWCKHININKTYYFLYEFILAISKVDNIKKELKIESACFILRYYNRIIKPINKVEVEYLNRNMINFLRDKSTFSDKDYRIILDSIIDNTFDEFKLFLFNQIEDYRMSIEFYLDEKNNIKNRIPRLFEFLNTNLEKLKEQGDKYEYLLNIIKKNIFSLAKISMKDFYELFKKIFWKEKKEIIQILEKDKLLQYNFVEIIIKSYIKLDEDNDYTIIIENQEEEDEIKDLLGMQIKLLCILKKFDDIVPALKTSNYYPLKECFNYCQDSGAYEAMIYIYLKEANYEKALKLSESKLNEIYGELTRNINGENSIDKYNELIISFDKYLNDCKNICENNYQEDLWFDILQLLYTYEKKSENLINQNKDDTEKNNSSKLLNQKIIQEIKELMEKMSTYVSINRIIEVVSEKNKNAGFKEFRELLIKILNNYDNLSNILLSARRLLTNLVLENETSFKTLNLKGEPLIINNCDKCGKKIDINAKRKGEILVFLCGHTYHKTCVKIKRIYECPLCRELEIGEMEHKGKSLVKRNTTIIEDNRNNNNDLQVNVTFSERKMILKLNRFDKKFFSNRKMLTDIIDD